MARRFTWLLLFALLLTPILGAVSSPARVLALDDATSELAEPSGDEEPTNLDDVPAADGTPISEPSETPTEEPSETPTEEPTETPTEEPSETPTEEPSATPTETPTEEASPSVAAAGVGSVADLVITLKCATSPETVRVTNTGSDPISLLEFETLVDQIAGEPFTLSRTLKPGQTAIFQTGAGAQYGTVLTPRFIFTNTAWDKEGLKLTTSAGVATKTCDPKPAPVDPVIANPGKLSDLTITLNCRAYTETVRVTNNGTGYILLKSLATYYDPLPGEPYRLNRVLKPGQTAIYQAGTGAQYGTVLTKEYIFTNSVWDKDGVRISTSAGKAFKACEAKPVPAEHWVEIDLSSQYLWAWEGNRIVNQTAVSTGKAGWETPTGTFYVLVKYRFDDMAGNVRGESWYVPAVPWTMYFTNWGHALHGAYWHNDFGTPRSHGCVNLPLPFAEWLYYWLPYGGRIVIHW